MADAYFRLFVHDHENIHETGEDLSLEKDLGGVAPMVDDVIITATPMRGSSTFRVTQRIRKPSGQIGLVPEFLPRPLLDFCGL